MTDSVRVRFAPSPTGTLHLGNARTALFNYIFARHTGGTLVLRIEDTDAERSTEASEQTILRDLRWLGISWDEGPDIGGPHAPYRQTDRKARHVEIVEALLQQGHAYLCFTTPQEMEVIREQQRERKEAPHYPGIWRDRDPAEVKAMLDQGVPSVIRFKITAPVVEFDDIVRGRVRFETQNLGGDFVLMRGDQSPTYNYAVVADDHDMRITHVLRGEDHLTNTAKQLLIYRALGWEEPKFGHLSIIMGPDKAKLSKRHGAVTVDAYRDAGMLPDALVNALALMGWSTGDDTEVMTPEEIIGRFSLERLVKTAAIFNATKVWWLNGQHLRKLTPEKFVELATAALAERGVRLDHWSAAERHERLAFLQDAIESWEQLADLMKMFDAKSVDFAHKDTPKILQHESTVAVVAGFAKHWDPEKPLPLDDLVHKITADAPDAKGKRLYQPLRLIVTGRPHGPDLHKLYDWIPATVVEARYHLVKAALATPTA